LYNLFLNYGYSSYGEQLSLIIIGSVVILNIPLTMIILMFAEKYVQKNQKLSA